MDTFYIFPVTPCEANNKIYILQLGLTLITEPCKGLSWFEVQTPLVCGLKDNGKDKIGIGGGGDNGYNLKNIFFYHVWGEFSQGKKQTIQGSLFWQIPKNPGVPWYGRGNPGNRWLSRKRPFHWPGSTIDLPSSPFGWKLPGCLFVEWVA